MSNGKITTKNPEDRLDRVAKREYGTEQGGTVEALFDANPGLADKGFFLTSVQEIDGPEVEPEEAEDIQRPWD